jgi:4-amino-4-deoxy-L-arabinose transferase-like glycosyltransferase
MFGPIGTAEMLLIFIVFFLPIILIALSPRTKGTKKFYWILLSIILSWIAYVLFLILTDKAENKKQIE